jgi:transposase
MPKTCSEEFKASALELPGQGMTQKQVCQDLGMSKSALQAWVKEARLHQHGFEPAEGAEGKAEQVRMLRRIREPGRRTRSCDRPPPTCPRRTSSPGRPAQNDVPAGP